MMKAVLFKSHTRFNAFKKKLESKGVDVVVLDFNDDKWLDFDFSGVDMAIYFPAFEFVSSHPDALYKAKINLTHLSLMHPHIRIFPSPSLMSFYADKYPQYLFLKAHKVPMPETYAVTGKACLKIIEEKLGFPLVVKNRYGAGGDFVRLIENSKDFEDVFELSRLNYFSRSGFKHIVQNLMSRQFLFWLIKKKSMSYPFYAFPLLAQRFIPHDRDLKVVVVDGQVVEAHWREKADGKMWKMNIDSGGIGVWSYVPENAINLSVELAKKLDATCLNIDMLFDGEKCLVSEFSPVWHHYKYQEKDTFEYKDDYNIPVPLEVSLDLEEIIVSSLTREPLASHKI